MSSVMKITYWDTMTNDLASIKVMDEIEYIGGLLKFAHMGRRCAIDGMLVKRIEVIEDSDPADTLSQKDRDILRYFHGMNERMQDNIFEIMRLTQEEDE